MPATESTAPLEVSERHAVARFLEATRDALDDQRIGYIGRARLAGYLVAKFDAAALAVRQGHRAHLLDRITGELDRVRGQLASDSDTTQ